jgi:hypothetical protein
LSFFQLCFNISDRAISILLSFLSSFFHALSSNSETLKALSDIFPKTLYSLRRGLKLEKHYVKYVNCMMSLSV